jgi:hypothetical protein
VIGPDTLLFPDTGDEFLRSLRSAALFSNQVHVLTLIDTRLSETIIDAFEKAGAKNGPVLARRVLEYFEFVRASYDDLSMLESEKVLIPVRIGRLNEISSSRESMHKSFQDRLNRLPNQDNDAYLRILELGSETYPPSYSEIDILLILVKIVEGKLSPKIIDDQEMVRTFLFLPYLLTVASVAEKRGINLATWSIDYQNAVWACRDLFSSERAKQGHRLQTRRMAEARLGQIVIERHLPCVEDLPFEEILSIRLKRADELEAFRVALAELATHIDVTQPHSDLELQARDLVASRVDPAVRDLRSALSVSRLEALSRVGKSWKTLAAATVPAAISYCAGAPLDVSAVVATLGGIGNALLETALERKKLLNASQWSVLIGREKSRRRVLKGRP